MITTKRLSWLGEWFDIGPFPRQELDRRGKKAVVNSQDVLNTLIYWLGMGARILDVESNWMLLKLWLLGVCHAIKINGTPEEIRPLIKAAFAFAKAKEVANPKDFSFPVNSSDFHGLLGINEIVAISDIAWRNRRLLMDANGWGKFAFLAGSGADLDGELFESVLKNLAMNELSTIVQFSVQNKGPIARVLRFFIDRLAGLVRRKS